MNYVRVYSDENGQSHFADMDLRLAPAIHSLAMPAVEACEPQAATQFQFMRLPAGWSADWHPAAAYQYICVLAGEVEMTVGDGDCRRFSGGDVVHLQDIIGKGHTSRVIGEQDMLIAVIRQA
jgi:quercetin dioxygenase-like cupin family protein